jgi:hypothetical protein
VGAEHRHPGEYDDQHQEQRRQQAPGAGEPELPEPDAATLDLAEQDIGDQIAAEGEEDADAEQSSRGPAAVLVLGDVPVHGDRAPPVEARHVALI